MDEQLKQNQIETGVKREEIWGGVTDPREHQDNRFRYLVHAFNPHSSIDREWVDFVAKQSGLETTEKGIPVNLFVKPEDISQRSALSLSLIDEKHRATWGNYGLIVEVPRANVILVSTSDSGSVPAVESILREQIRRNPPMNGDQLIANSSPNTYNEVVSLGKTESGEAKVVGFFAKIDAEGYLDQSQVWRLKQHAERLNLPFVEISAESPFERDEIQITPQQDEIYINYLSKRYILCSGNKSVFDVLNSRRETHFMSPNEADELFRFLESRIAAGEVTMEGAALDDLRKEYAIADRARRTPSFKYDKDHNVEGFHFYTGYGNQEYEYRVNQYVASRINTTVFKAEMKKSLVEGDSYVHPNDISHYQVNVSPEEIEKILQDISVFADPETIEIARRFITIHQASIQNAHNQELKRRGSYVDFFKWY